MIPSSLPSEAPMLNPETTDTFAPPTVEYQPPAVAAPIDPQTAMIQMIERVALDPSASIEKLEKMLDLRERIEDRAKQDRADEQRAAYFRAMAECQGALKVVKRNKHNAQTKSNYADLSAIAHQADPIIHAHGFTVSFQPAGRADNGDERIRWTIAHIAGHIESDTAQLALDDKGPNGSANKTRLHGFGSTMSYGRRYLKLMLFDIATRDDDDGNAAGADTITEEQEGILRDLLTGTNSDEAKFLKHFGVESLETFPAAKYGAADGMLRRKLKEKGAQQ